MIHIALTIDENYVRYCTVVMASILENNKMDDITFHIVANDLTSKAVCTQRTYFPNLCSNY